MWYRGGFQAVAFAWFLFGPVAGIAGQVRSPGKPFGFSPHLKAAEVMYVLPPVDPMEVEAGMEENRAEQAKVLHFAVEREVDLSPEFNGSWFTSDGMRIWQVHILSPGAYSLGVVFNVYAVEPGVKVFVYDPDLRQVKGAFTSLNNKASGILPVGHLEGEEVIVEMQVPRGMQDFGQLRIESVSHAYLDLKDPEEGGSCDPGIFGCSQACMVDVNCEEGADWQTEKRSVVRIYTTRQYCTGVLVNNTAYDGTPYVLTAEHCLSSENYANKSVFLFNYESPACFGEEGPTDMSVAESSLIAVGDSIDFSLVRLSLVPPLTYNAYYAGWDRSPDQQTPGTSIHHPWGDVKKITLDKDAPSVPVKPGDVPYTDLDDYHYFSFWWIKRWDTGSTQGGSSGGPLFNSTGRVIGTLSGGVARCGDSIGYDVEKDRVIYSNAFNYDDYFTQLRFAWDYYGTPSQSLKPWLDPANSGVNFIGGYDPVGYGPVLKATDPQFLVYPNPATTTLFISGGTPSTGTCAYEILNLYGAVILQGTLEGSGFSSVGLSGMEPGVYWIRITGNGMLESHPFVIAP